jgi:hypothetical protein
MLDNLYNNEYQQACSDLKQFLNWCIVNCAASAGQIDALEWARDQGIHGGAELCMIAAWEGWSLACFAMAPRGWGYLGQSCHLLCWGTWVQLCCRMGQREWLSWTIS